MPTVNDLIRTKGSREIWSISPDATVYEALQMLAEKNIGALLVMTGDKVDGIMSERDIVRKIDLTGKTSREMKVREIMTTHVLYLDIKQSLEDCMALMTEHKVRHLPVLENQRLVGMISIGDVLKEIVSDQQYMIVSARLFQFQCRNAISWNFNGRRFCYGSYDCSTNR
jgi:predicted transcriptional regulator